METKPTTPLWRTRWASIGAVVAVAIGGGSLYIAQADTASIFVPVTPTRVLDTRNNIGLSGPFQHGVARILDVTGVIPVAPSGTATVVPDGATAVVLNVTVLQPTRGGFVSVRPGDAIGDPSTSNLNFTAGATIPNSVTVQLPTAGANSGKLNLFYFGGVAGNTTNMLVDIVGYFQTGDSGPPGAQGPAGDPGTVNRISDKQIAMQRWDLDPGSNAVIPLGASPREVAFDGTYVWVGNYDDDTVSKVDPATNAVVAVIPVGDGPEGMAFDGTSIWVANWNEGTVSKINVDTHAVTGSPNSPVIAVDGNPTEVVFDGTHIWVSNFGNTTVSKIDPVTNAEVAVVNVLGNPTGLAFDGERVWVSINNSDVVRPINITTNAPDPSVTVGSNPSGIAFDGTFLWVAIESGDSLKKIDPTTDTVVGTSFVGIGPKTITYDGTNLWVTTATGGGTVYRVNPTSGDTSPSTVGVLAADGIGFDGTNIWVVSNVGFVLKFLPF